MDGDWEAPLVNNPACAAAPGCGPWAKPMIDNPNYKGKWFAPMINNPGYQGKWKPAKIPNPDYYHDAEPYKMTPIAGIGIELWTMSDAIYFDNILITNNFALADSFAKETFDVKMSVSGDGGNIFKRILDYSNKNPWLYAVYVVLVGLPTVLIVTFCCSGSAEKSGDKSSLNDPKKTDEVQEDDEASEEAAAEQQEEGEGEEEEEEVEDEGTEEEEAPDTPSASTRSQTRKRRPRKE